MFNKNFRKFKSSLFNSKYFINFTNNNEKAKIKKEKNSNLNINNPKNKNARKSFTFLDLIKQENHQNLRNSMILAQPNFINNNFDKIKH